MCEEGDPFEFNDFIDTLQPKNGLATKKEIDELLIFIGGFEKWPVLIEDCRREVVKYLDFQSRLNLGICSKDDNETVEKTKICVKSIEIKDTQKQHYFFNNNDEFDNVTVLIQFPTRSPHNPFKWVFSQLEQDTRIQWLPRIQTQRFVVKEVIWKSCNYYQESVKFAERWMKKSNFELEAIKIEMGKYPFATSQIESLPCCEKVTIGDDDVDSFKWWLKKCPKQLKNLDLDVHSKDRESFILPFDFLNAPHVMQASEINFGCRAAFSDEQLLKLKAKSIAFVSADVTDKGINKFMKNWAHGDGVDGFEDLCLWSTTVRNPDLMFAGLEYVEWDKTFENEQWEFVERFHQFYLRGRCFQIKSKVDRFESLTFSVNGDRVAIVATGKRAEKNGEAYTYYRIP
ncbi:hypothetical protein CAEBREN_14620 [Caenorhabditis brenneri]|uniref:F-box associated domain-containing protein n=1 Tax=Caenorhabditis brenneri TaxID=135651 RepID=G0N069_CAEBE|nr:hypothetical protein CAEBREN_14620 [Caenorhabditis brenneri]